MTYRQLHERLSYKTTRMDGFIAGMLAGLFAGIITLNPLVGLEMGLFLGILAVLCK